VRASQDGSRGAEFLEGETNLEAVKSTGELKVGIDASALHQICSPYPEKGMRGASKVYAR